MTTSIPEAPGSSRNWDYRYCWLRDAFFVVRALNSLSEVGTMEEYLRWLTNIVARSKGGHIQPLYGIGLEEQLPESTLDHLPGYRGNGPGARRQPGAGTLPARRLRQYRARRGAGFLRPPLVPPGRARPSSPRWKPWATRHSACTRTGRRHVGAAHARPRPHLVHADELGRLRPPGEDRRKNWACRSAPTHWNEPRRADPRAPAARGVERGAPGLRRKPGRARPRRQPCC